MRFFLPQFELAKVLDENREVYLLKYWLCIKF